MNQSTFLQFLSSTFVHLRSIYQLEREKCSHDLCVEQQPFVQRAEVVVPGKSFDVMRERSLHPPLTCILGSLSQNGPVHRF